MPAIQISFMIFCHAVMASSGEKSVIEGENSLMRIMSLRDDEERLAL